MWGLGRKELALSLGRDSLVSVTKWVMNAEWTFTAQMKMRNVASVVASGYAQTQQRLTGKQKQSLANAPSHGWVKKDSVIVVGICVRKMLIAKEARFVVSMAVKRTVSTLVS